MVFRVFRDQPEFPEECEYTELGYCYLWKESFEATRRHWVCGKGDTRVQVIPVAEAKEEVLHWIGRDLFVRLLNRHDLPNYVIDVRVRKGLIDRVTFYR